MSKVIIDTILKKIRENDSDALVTIKDQLALLPIAFLSIEKANILLATFLNQVLIHKNRDIVRLLIDTFDEVRIRTDPLPAITQIVINHHLLMEVVKFVITCYPEKQPQDYFIDLINSTDDRLAVEAGNLLTKLFPNLNGTTWKYLYSLTEPFEDEPYHNPLLRDFLEWKLSQIRPVLEQPSYIRDYEAVPLEPITFKLPTVDEAVQKILDHLNFNFVNSNTKIVDIKEPLIFQYAISTLDEKRALLSEIGSDLIPEFDETPIFREYGPVNTIYKHDYLEFDHECCKWGGCRMLLCNEFEITNDDLMADEIEDVDWFTGECSECKITIPFRHYAIREPLPNGGWRGCYCNPCLANLMKESPLFERLQEQLNRIGIRKR